MVGFRYDDGGRAEVGYRGKTDDCVVRAIAIAADLPYKKVYDDLYGLAGSSPREGVKTKVYRSYLERTLGWVWVPTMFVGQGCKVHLRQEELPGGRLVLRLSRHLTAMIDGVVHDIYDPCREGTRCVYGYYRAP